MTTKTRQRTSKRFSPAAGTHKRLQRRSNPSHATPSIGLQLSVAESAALFGRASILSRSITAVARRAYIASLPTTQRLGYITTSVFPRAFARSTRTQPSSRHLVQSPSRSHVAIPDAPIFASHTASSAASTMQPRLAPFANEPESPNHALQRTAPRVTLAAADHPAACAHPAPAAFPQPARRPPQSLSLGSFGDSSRVL
jgi:hypothetical protein